ncbi:TetR/AcrR family transcriptional regulator [Streptomyces sp. NPDC055709]
MPRPADLAKRQDLLERVRDYVIKHGLSGLSLRPMARALGTSDRMLLYYFGTKERMVAEALALDERRPLLQIREVLDMVGPPQDAAGIRRFVEELWQRFSVPEDRALLPLYLELMTASVLRPDQYGPVMRDILTEWTNLLTSLFTGLGMPKQQAGQEATLLVDSVFGLLFAPLADADWDRADEAFHTLLDRLEPGWQT